MEIPILIIRILTVVLAFIGACTVALGILIYLASKYDPLRDPPREPRYSYSKTEEELENER